MTWRARRLWIFGLFAGGASGSCGGGSTGLNFNFDARTSQPFPADVRLPSQADIDRVLIQTMTTLQANWAIVLAVGVALMAAWLVVWAVSVACRAALIEGGAALAEQRATGLGGAWRTGLTSFGKLLGLDALLLVLGLATLAAAIGAIFRFALHPGAAVDWLALFVVLGTFGVVSFPVWTVLGVLVAYARRAIVLDQAGPLQALAIGWRLARGRPGATALVWIAGLGVGVAGLLAIMVVTIPIAIPAGIMGVVGFLLVQSGQIAPLGVLLIALAVVLIVAWLLVATAALNTFSWHFWTLAYLRLARAAEPPPAN